MLLRCHGYPQRQASIPGYRPAVPELLPGAWAGARAIWVGKGGKEERFVGSELCNVVRREDACTQDARRSCAATGSG